MDYGRGYTHWSISWISFCVPGGSAGAPQASQPRREETSADEDENTKGNKSFNDVESEMLLCLVDPLQFKSFSSEWRRFWSHPSDTRVSGKHVCSLEPRQEEEELLLTGTQYLVFLDSHPTHNNLSWSWTGNSPPYTITTTPSTYETCQIYRSTPRQQINRHRFLDFTRSHIMLVYVQILFLCYFESSYRKTEISRLFYLKTFFLDAFLRWWNSYFFQPFFYLILF